MKDNIRNIIAAVEGYLREEKIDGDIEVEVYLSGKQNFRNKIATIPGSFKTDGTPCTGYKANRADNHRPYWYQRIRDYLVEVWDAKIIEGIEADDALAIEQWQQDEYDPQTIIATIDKDLQNVPGWHYNVYHQRDTLITYAKAQEHFYRQCLTGDPTDNIPGCYRVGKAKAEAVVQEGMTEQEMYDAVLAVYEENVQKHPERHGPYGMKTIQAVKRTPPYTARDAARESLLENARLLWMLQHPDQLWTPPGQPDASITDAGLLDEEEWG